jgi:DNA repair protein RecO (recombination protein O)
MLFTTEGIVISYIKYGETSVIARIYTRDFGLRSYIQNGTRSLKGNKVALFQPLSVIHLVVYHKENTEINRISEIRSGHPLISMRIERNKMVIAFFLSEIIAKAVKEAGPDEGLYYFLKESITTLESASGNFLNFHLTFLIRLSSYLGFYPSTEEHLFEFTPAHSFTEEEKTIVIKFIHAQYDEKIDLRNTLRRKILNLLLHFYASHIEGWGTVNSVKILEEVLTG